MLRHVEKTVFLNLTKLADVYVCLFFTLLRFTMTFQSGNTGFFFCFMLIGAILGSALGALIVKIVPSLSILTKNLTGPIGLNLEIISFSLKLNLSAIIGLIGGVIIFRKI